MIESGAIIHAFVGEERPPASGIMNLVKKTFENTQAAQLTISPEFTICTECKRITPRLTDTCAYCDATNINSIQRLASHDRINNWERTKVQELVDRHKDNYSVTNGSLKKC